MTKTLSPIQPSTDTFQVWLQRTNDLVNELSTSIVTASVLGDSTTGNATLIGNFTANTIIGSEYVRTNTVGNISGNTVPIDIISPVKITSPEQNSFTIRNTSGPRIRVQNDSVAWLVGLNGSAGTGTGAQFVIGVEGSPFQVRVGVDGFLYANTVLLDDESSNVASAVRSSRTISTNGGITGGGDLTANRTLSLTGNALSLHNLSANGIVTKTASGTVTARTMTQSTGITITNGNGVAGNPTFAIDTSVVATVSTAQTITGNKTFSGLTIFDGNVQLNGNTVISQGDYISFDGKIVLSSNTTNGIISFGGSDTYFKSLNANTSIYFQDSTSTTKLTLNTTSGNLIVAGDVLAYSDSRLKSNIRPITNAIDKVSAMRGVYFEKDGKQSLGVIAQEIETIVPEAVIDGEYKSVAYGNLVGVLIEAIKELKREVDELKTYK